MGNAWKRIDAKKRNRGPISKNAGRFGVNSKCQERAVKVSGEIRNLVGTLAAFIGTLTIVKSTHLWRMSCCAFRCATSQIVGWQRAVDCPYNCISSGWSCCTRNSDLETRRCLWRRGAESRRCTTSACCTYPLLAPAERWSP